MTTSHVVMPAATPTTMPMTMFMATPTKIFMVACMCQKLSSGLGGYNNTHKKKFHLLGEHNSSMDRFGLPSAIASLFK
jgi:hypothetical protein